MSTLTADLRERALALREWLIAMPHFPGIKHGIVRQVDTLDALIAEREKFKTVMIAAAEEIALHWQAHCDAEGYGPSNLMRRLEEGIPAEYLYSAGDFEKLRTKIDAIERATAQRCAEIALVALGENQSPNTAIITAYKLEKGKTERDGPETTDPSPMLPHRGYAR